MTVLDYILDGLEAELALERELGVRFVECDRGLLAKPSPLATPHPTPTTPPTPPPSPTPTPLTPPPTPLTSYPFIFLHHQPLSPAGLEMMKKIIEAMHTTLESAPIITDMPVPKAKVYVILGGLALKKFQPKLKGVPGQWLKTEKDADVLVTYSPEYILRFKEVTSGVKKIKQDMWLALKGVLRRL